LLLHDPRQSNSLHLQRRIGTPARDSAAIVTHPAADCPARWRVGGAPAKGRGAALIASDWPYLFKAGVGAVAELDMSVDAPEPMLDSRLADQWFAGSNAEDQALDQVMIATLRKDVGPRFAKLKENASKLTAEQAKGELHALRGAVSSIGLLACAQPLRELEKDWTMFAASTRQAKLTTADANFSTGLAELYKRFPHLKEP